MALSPEQIGDVATIIMMPKSAAASLVSALDSVDIADTVEDIAEFAKVKNKFVDVSQVGSIKLGVTPQSRRLGIRNRVRIRLGLLPLESETDLYGSGYSTIEYSHPEDCSTDCCD